VKIDATGCSTQPQKSGVMTSRGISVRDKQPVWVILGADQFQGQEVEPSTLVTAKAVVRSEDFAKAAVERLNALRQDNTVTYWCQLSRLVEPNQITDS
jgi:hypothetical protein